MISVLKLKNITPLPPDIQDIYANDLDNCIILAERTGYTERTAFGEFTFNYSGTYLSYKAKTTYIAPFMNSAQITILVNDVLFNYTQITDESWHEFTLPEGLKKVTIVESMQTNGGTGLMGTFLTGVKVDVNASFARQYDNRNERIVFLGDSITVGANSTNAATQGFSRLFSYRRGKRVLFYAWGYGSVFQLYSRNPNFTDTINNLSLLFGNATIKKLVIALGTNDLGNPVNEAAFGDRYAILLDNTHTAIPDAHIYCISPIFVGNPSTEPRVAAFRPMIEDNCATRNYTTYINGVAICTYPQHYADLVHPNTLGMDIYESTIYPILYP